ncbi:MAG: LysR family transcriptional regulator [Sandaracinaceae bacterium]|nr:LysR family transcriptional regulator [Sandaracinaceae bacterium]
MNTDSTRNLDLNLLRVFVVVADAGSVTEAAKHLYLTQPAVSAALKRLREAVGARLFARQGRRLVLTSRGEALLTDVRPHLRALLDAAFAPSRFDPATSERTVRLGLADSTVAWLLAPLLRILERDAPNLRVVVLPVQFRSVGAAMLSGRVDLAVTVADDLPAGVSRRTLYHGNFVCLYDPAHVRLGRRPTLERYLAQRHVIVSYNGDLRGILEDIFGVTRQVRCSVASFDAIGPVVDGSQLVATVPARVADTILALRPHLATARVPVRMQGTPVELLARRAVEDDPAVRYVRDRLFEIAEADA